MSALKSVRLAIEVATEQRDAAGQALVRIDRRRQAALGQMEQLDAYAGETATRWAPGALERPGAEIVAHYYQFMERLQQAIEMQRGVLEGLRRESEAAQRALLAAEVRMTSLRRLLDAKLAELARERARSDQKQMDEFAMLAHRRLRQAQAEQE